MRFTTIIAAAAAMVSSAFAACDKSSLTAINGNIISAPYGGQTVKMGSSFTLTWTPSTDGPIDILLLAGPTVANFSSIDVLASGVPNNGSYTWTVPKSGSGLISTLTSGYGIKIIDTESCQFSESSSFGIEDPTAVTKTITLARAISTVSSSTLSSTSTLTTVIANATGIATGFVTAVTGSGTGTGSGTAMVTSPVLAPTKSMTVPASLKAKATSTGGTVSTTQSKGLAAPTAAFGWNAGVMVVAGMVGAVMI